jgi:hypothetical protein
MQNAYRTVKRLEGDHLLIDLPSDFPKTGDAEVIILPLDSIDETMGRLVMREWLARAWGCAPDFPDRPDPLPLDDILPL